MLGDIATKGIELFTITTAPIQRIVDSSCCITHQYCNDQALALYQANGFIQEAMLINQFYDRLQQGVIWADQEWQNIHHFLQPKTRQGLWQFSSAAYQYMSHFKTTVKYLQMGQMDKAVFYLGAAAHVVQDVCVPHHAKCKLFDGHKQYERWVEKNSTEFSLSTNYYNFSDHPMDTMLGNVTVALDFYDYVTSDAGEEKYRAATNILLPLAQKATILLFSHFINQAKSAGLSFPKRVLSATAS